MNSILLKQIQKFEAIVKKIPEIRYAGDPVLRTKTEKASLAEGKKIGNALRSVLVRYRALTGVGRGLAAPQIGIAKSVFVSFVEEKFYTFINPTIPERSKETNFYRELCLSSGMMSADVERPAWIIMEWMDAEGVKHKEKISGFLARLYQHEEAHLRGKVNLDESYSGGIAFATFDPLKETLRTSRN